MVVRLLLCGVPLKLDYIQIFFFKPTLFYEEVQIMYINSHLIPAILPLTQLQETDFKIT